MVTMSREEMIAVASTYLDALVSHDASAVPLAPNCWRTEEGKNSGVGADDIRTRIKSEVMHGISGYRDLRWWVDGDDVIAFYMLDAGATAQIVERFRVIDGVLHEIEAVFYIHPGANVDRWPVDLENVWPQPDAG